jgi:hypothetical protein
LHSGLGHTGVQCPLDSLSPSEHLATQDDFSVRRDMSPLMLHERQLPEASFCAHASDEHSPVRVRKNGDRQSVQDDPSLEQDRQLSMADEHKAQ